MNYEFKDTYQESLICPIIITNISCKVLYKNIAADKILSFVRKGASILRYISDETICQRIIDNKDSGMSIISIKTYIENTSEYEGLMVPLTLDDMTQIYCFLFKNPIIMLDYECNSIKESLLKSCMPLFKNLMSEIFKQIGGCNVKEVNRFVKNNCSRIYHMDKILSNFYIQSRTSKFAVRGVYEVRILLRELRDCISESSTYLGYRISYNVDDYPFLLYSEPEHFYVMLIYVSSILFHYTTDGKVNVSYTTDNEKSSAKLTFNTATKSAHEFNRFDHSFFDLDIHIARFFADLCSCTITHNLENDLFELDIHIALSEKIKGLLKSHPDIQYLGGICEKE